MWKKTREGLSEFYEAVWLDSTWKGKLSMLFGLIGGILFGTILVHSEFAKQGCNALTEWYHLVFNGILGLFMVLIGFGVVGLIFRALLHIPDCLAERHRTADRRRREKEFAKEWKLERRKTLGYKYIDPDTAEKIKFWTVLIVGIIVTVGSISFAAGYIWWSVFC